MASAASRVAAAAMKRPLWQNSAPLTPEACSSASLVRPAQAAGRSARRAKPSSDLRMPPMLQSLPRGLITNHRWSAPALTTVGRKGMPIGSSSTRPSPACSIEAITIASARNFAALRLMRASTNARAMPSARWKASVSASGSVLSKTGFSVSRRLGRTIPANCGPAAEGLSAPLSTRSTGRTKPVSNELWIASILASAMPKPAR